jgi:hypothetical protein
MAAFSSIAIGGALAAGAIGGAIKGSQKTPGTQLTSTPSYSGALSANEKQLQQQAIQQYLQQINQTNQLEQGIGALDPLRQQAISGYGDILSGQAMQATPQELQQIEQLRQAQIGLGTQDINRLLGQAQSQTNQLAGVRGLRGQALGELQGQNTQMAAQQIGNVVNQAGVQAAQQVMDNPFRRISAQQQALQQGLTYQDQLRQNAVQNRQLAANPAMLNYYQQGRAQQTTETTPSSGGGFWNGLAGGLSGGAAGLGLGTSVANLGSTMGATGGMMNNPINSQVANTPFTYRSDFLGT